MEHPQSCRSVLARLCDKLTCSDKRKAPRLDCCEKRSKPPNMKHFHLWVPLHQFPRTTSGFIAPTPRRLHHTPSRRLGGALPLLPVLSWKWFHKGFSKPIQTTKSRHSIYFFGMICVDENKQPKGEDLRERSFRFIEHSFSNGTFPKYNFPSGA